MEDGELASNQPLKWYEIVTNLEIAVHFGAGAFHALFQRLFSME